MWYESWRVPGYGTIASLVCAASAASSCARVEANATLPPRSSPCVISGDGEPILDPEHESGPFDVYEARTGNRPIAKVRFPSAVAATWSGFVQDEKLARVTLRKGGLELSGLAEYEARRFALLHTVELFGPHVVARQGSFVHITAISGRLASIAIETELSEPRMLDTTIDCGELVYGGDEPGPAEVEDENPQFMELIGERIVLYDAPGGTPLLTVRGPASPPYYPRLMATRDGYARIRHLWGTLIIDAWLLETQVRAKRAASIQAGPAAQVPEVAPPTLALEGPGKRVVIQVATVLRRASISVGQRPGRAIGTLNPGAVVRVLAAAGGALGVRLVDVYVEPPEGQYFWIEGSALSATREAVVEENEAL